MAVCCDFLQHDWSWNDRLDGVATRSAMADGVSVDFVDDVAGMAILLVCEACDVDSTALGSWADPRLAARVNKGVIDVLRGGETKAVQPWLGFVGCRVVHHKCAVVETDDIWSPDSRSLRVDPSWDVWQSIDTFSEGECLPIGCEGPLHMDQLASDVGVGGEQMPAIGGPDDSWIWEVDSAHDGGEGCSLLDADGSGIGESGESQGA